MRMCYIICSFVLAILTFVGLAIFIEAKQNEAVARYKAQCELLSNSNATNFWRECEE